MKKLLKYTNLKHFLMVLFVWTKAEGYLNNHFQIFKTFNTMKYANEATNIVNLYCHNKFSNHENYVFSFSLISILIILLSISPFPSLDFTSSRMSKINMGIL